MSSFLPWLTEAQPSTSPPPPQWHVCSCSGACGLYCYWHKWKFCAHKGSASETGQPKLDTVGLGICTVEEVSRIKYGNLLLFSWPEVGVFINGPRVKGFSEPGPVFLICHSLVGAAVIGCCEGSMIMSVLPHCEWCLSPTENVLWPERGKGRIVNVWQQSSSLGEVMNFCLPDRISANSASALTMRKGGKC